MPSTDWTKRTPPTGRIPRGCPGLTLPPSLVWFCPPSKLCSSGPLAPNFRKDGVRAEPRGHLYSQDPSHTMGSGGVRTDTNGPGGRLDFTATATWH